MMLWKDWIKIHSYLALGISYTFEISFFMLSFPNLRFRNSFSVNQGQSPCAIRWLQLLGWRKENSTESCNKIRKAGRPDTATTATVFSTRMSTQLAVIQHKPTASPPEQLIPTLSPDSRGRLLRQVTFLRFWNPVQLPQVLKISRFSRWQMVQPLIHSH